MASTLQKELEASHWGIEPIPEEHRKLTGLDLGVLWGDLGVGLLVIVAGALLTAPAEQFGFGLSLPAATAAIVLGSVVGCVLLGIGGVIGSREAKPTMVLFRPVLGTKGSWIPTILNVGQLIGWTAFELWAMALVADRLGERLFGFSAFGFWLVFFSVVVLALSFWGPLGVVRHWMEKFGAWVVGAIGLAITIALLDDLGRLWSRPGGGGSIIFGIPMDIVIALPVSWIPLVADYNRFSKRQKGSFWGTTLGYLIANIWFYGLGALLVVGSAGANPSPEGIAVGILSLAGVSVTGTLLLAGLLVGETDEAFADVYSGAVSLRNIFPKTDSRVLIVVVTGIGAVLAGQFTMLNYEAFLFLLGSVFVPLLGVWFADYFVLKVRHDGGRSFRWSSLVPWLAGFALYHWIAPTPLEWWSNFVTGILGDPLSQRFVWLGASLPSFALAFALHVGISWERRNDAQLIEVPDRASDNLLRVQVISEDDRVIQAARALPPRFEVTISSSRDRALAAIELEGCDLAVIELEGGGFGTAKDLRARDETRDARVVMLCDRAHDRWLCMQAGADEVIIKPLADVTTLIEAVERALQTAKTS